MTRSIDTFGVPRNPWTARRSNRSTFGEPWELATGTVPAETAWPARLDTLSSWLPAPSRPRMADDGQEQRGEPDRPGEALPVAIDPSAQAADPLAETVLSPRELEVVRQVAGGKSNREIAESLFIARSTVERHVANILSKLGFHTRVQIAAWAAVRGLAAG